MSGTKDPQLVDDIIRRLTGGRPFVFVIMAYQKGYAIYERFKAIIENEFGLACLRADDVHVAGHDLLDRIHRLIEHAEIVVAEISPRGPNDFSPNVYYEVGYAIARQKEVLLLAEQGTEIPTDLKGLEVVEHGGSQAAMAQFNDSFRSHLRNRLNPGTGLLRDMLQGSPSKPAIIVAHPKYPGPNSRSRGHLFDRCTFGDNVGIVGLLSSFGAMFGEQTGCELVSAIYEDLGEEVDDRTRRPVMRLMHEDVNLYLIGSGKVNPLAGELLRSIMVGKSPGWELAPKQGEEEVADYIVELYKHQHGTREAILGKTDGDGRSQVHVLDHGIVVRAPHPAYPSRVVVFMAGPHSLGTGAACMAATRSTLIRQIRDKLPSREQRAAFADKSRTVWALISGMASASDGMLREENVKVVDAGVYA